MIINGLNFLTPSEALALLQSGAVLVDLREEYCRNGREFDVPEVLSVCHKDFTREFSRLPKDRMIILADYVGLYSKEAGYLLLANGYTKVASLTGGIVDWAIDGMPTKIDHNEELVGGCACQLKKRKTVKE